MHAVRVSVIDRDEVGGRILVVLVAHQSARLRDGRRGRIGVELAGEHLLQPFDLFGPESRNPPEDMRGSATNGILRRLWQIRASANAREHRRTIEISLEEHVADSTDQFARACFPWRDGVDPHIR